MADEIVWKKGAGWLALLAIAGCAELAHAADARNLGGVWQCHFLVARNRLESTYYSAWVFDSAKNWVDVFWSPVHKGDSFYYRWDEKQLVLDYPWGPPRPTFGVYKTRLQPGGELIIENRQMRWKGWRCTRQPGVRWPEDGLQFLDYGRYPWLSGLIEDGPSIMEYRHPKQYEEWRKGRLR